MQVVFVVLSHALIYFIRQIYLAVCSLLCASVLLKEGACVA